MSKLSKELADSAKEDLKSAKDRAKKASQKFKMIGDKKGSKLADDAANAADKGAKYVEERMR